MAEYIKCRKIKKDCHWTLTIYLDREIKNCNNRRKKKFLFFFKFFSILSSNIVSEMSFFRLSSMQEQKRTGTKEEPALFICIGRQVLHMSKSYSIEGCLEASLFSVIEP